jgi:hypothetical protein
MHRVSNGIGSDLNLVFWFVGQDLQLQVQFELAASWKRHYIGATTPTTTRQFGGACTKN